MSAHAEGEVPEGAALMPTIPAELNVHPLLLAVLHATIFLDGSEDDVLDPDAAVEALEYMATLVSFARQEKWPKQLVQALKTFLDDYGIGKGEA